MNLLEQATQPASTEYREIPLTQGQVAIVDAADYEALAQYKWCAQWSEGTGTFYASRNAKNPAGGKTTVSMHRQIMGFPGGFLVDHRDGNGVNNRRDNLRLATTAQNIHNRRTSGRSASGYKGVHFFKRTKQWGAYIKTDGRQRWLGIFDTVEAAHAVYVEAAKAVHGEFANWGGPGRATRPPRTNKNPELGDQPASQTYCALPLTKGQSAIVDREDYERLAVFNWYATWSESAGTFYATRSIHSPAGREGSKMQMHRELLSAPPGVTVDHRNGDGLDNRRNNLRLATRSQNACNRAVFKNSTSGIKSVIFHKQNRRWRARIQIDGERISLGCFATKQEAQAAYISAAARIHGEFANWGEGAGIA